MLTTKNILLMGILCVGTFFGTDHLLANDSSREAAFYRNLAQKLEPSGHGQPDRLAHYFRIFRQETLSDRHLFPFSIEATRQEDGTVVLTGYVGYEENRTTLLTCLEYLGFDKVVDRIEVLPSKWLGSRRYGLVTDTHAFLYDRLHGEREVMTNCLLGTPVYLLREEKDKGFLCHSFEGYIGYIESRAIRRMERNEFTRYRQGSQVVLLEDIRSGPFGLMPAGARLKWVGEEKGTIVAELPSCKKVQLPCDKCLYCSRQPSELVQRVINTAKQFLGTEYVWGGNTSKGIDCSGLVQTSFKAQGINLPRDSNQQALLGALVATRWFRVGLRPGDTLYFLNKHGKISHTALYLGNDRYIEAVRPVVRYTSFNPADKEYNASRAASFCFAKRLFD